MSNLSPFIAGDHSERRKSRPELPSYAPEIHADSEPDAESIISSASTELTTPSEFTEEVKRTNIIGNNDITDEEKLQAIVDEFGDIAGLMAPSEGENVAAAERILAESKGSFFK